MHATRRYDAPWHDDKQLLYSGENYEQSARAPHKHAELAEISDGGSDAVVHAGRSEQ